MGRHEAPYVSTARNPWEVEDLTGRDESQVAEAHEFALRYVELAEAEMDEEPGRQAWLEVLYELAFGIALSTVRGDSNAHIAWENTMERLLSWLRLREA